MENFDQHKDQVRKLLAQGRLDQAASLWVETISNLEYPDERNQAILIALGIKDLKKADSRGNMAFDDILKNRQKFAKELLFLVDAC